MLAWIVLLIAALAGLHTAFGSDTQRLQSMPGLPVAIAIAGAMSLLYLLTLRKSADETSSGFARVQPVLAFAAAAIATIPALQSAELWPWVAPSPGPTETRQAPPSSSSRAAVRIRRGDDGRFSAQGDVNGAPVRLIVDSGAAAVMLKASDAEAAGLDVKNLAFDAAIETANGATYVAAVRLRSVTIGAIRLEDVEGFVAKPGSLNESLLGMSFLRRLTSYDLREDFMTLRQ